MELHVLLYINGGKKEDDEDTIVGKHDSFGMTSKGTQYVSEYEKSMEGLS